MQTFTKLMNVFSYTFYVATFTTLSKFSLFQLYEKDRPYHDFDYIILLNEKNGIHKSKSYRHGKAAADFVDVSGSEMKSVFLYKLKTVYCISQRKGGSTDSSVQKQETLHVSFLHKLRSKCHFLEWKHQSMLTQVAYKKA